MSEDKLSYRILKSRTTNKLVFQGRMVVGAWDQERAYASVDDLAQVKAEGIAGLQRSYLGYKLETVDQGDVELPPL